MRLTPEFERTLRRYVLGDLDEGLRVELEELLVTDPDAFEALGVVEDELIEAYLEGAGSATERRAFDERFLTSPERRRRLNLTRLLKDRASSTARALQAEPLPERPSQARPGRPAWLETIGDWLRPARWQPAWVAAAAVLAASLIGNAWLISRYRSLEPPLSHPAKAPVGAAPAVSIAELDASSREPRLPKAEAPVRTVEAPAARPRTPVATFALAAGLQRAQGSLTRITVPPDVVLVRLRLELSEAGYPLYRAALQDPDGAEIWSASRLRSAGQPGRAAVVVAVPSELLPRGDFLLKLQGISASGEAEAVATFPFRVSAP